ncbi:MAG: hypothetical protein ACTSRG_25600 [Candidatus Helarchaeota archaeon]
MYINKSEIKEKINRLCELPPGKPNDFELDKILDQLKKLPAYQRTENNLKTIVKNLIPQAGTYFTKGLDTSDINLLLQQINELLK